MLSSGELQGNMSSPAALAKTQRSQRLSYKGSSWPIHDEPAIRTKYSDAVFCRRGWSSNRLPSV